MKATNVLNFLYSHTSECMVGGGGTSASPNGSGLPDS